METQESQSISRLLYVQQVQITNSLNGNDLLQELFGDRQLKGHQSGLNSSIHICLCPPPDNTQAFLGLKIPNLLKISVFTLAFAFVLTLTRVCLPLRPHRSGSEEHWIGVHPVCPFVHSEEKQGAKSTNGF